MIRFRWDPQKAVANRRKHGVGFEEAVGVFYDPQARLLHDPDHSEREDRYLLLGLSATLRLLVVSHTYRAGDGVIRIISARKAAKGERDHYSCMHP